MAKEFGFIVFGRGRRTWSRLPARSALLLRRGLHRRPAPLDTLRVPRLRAVCTQLKKENDHLLVIVSFWQGQKDLNPRHAVLERFRGKFMLYFAIPFRVIPSLPFSLILRVFLSILENFLCISRNCRKSQKFNFY